MKKKTKKQSKNNFTQIKSGISFYQYLEKLIKKLVILIYWRWDFPLFVPNLNLTFKLVLLFIVFKTGQRADFNAKEFLVLIVGEIYSLNSDEIWVPLWATLYSLPKIPVMYPWPIRPSGPKKLTRSPGSYVKSPPNVEGACCVWVWLIPDFIFFRIRANFELSLSSTW